MSQLLLQLGLGTPILSYPTSLLLQLFLLPAQLTLQLLHLGLHEIFYFLELHHAAVESLVLGHEFVYFAPLLCCLLLLVLYLLLECTHLSLQHFIMFLVCTQLQRQFLRLSVHRLLIHITIMYVFTPAPMHNISCYNIIIMN